MEEVSGRRLSNKGVEYLKALFGRRAHEVLKCFLERQIDAELSDHLSQHRVAEKLAVNEHTIAVEDDEGRAEHVDRDA
jgi:hypothetical protein